MKPKVVVIMSTYNGEKYLKEQIDSILAQKQVDVYLHIFDDVSKDNTINIIKEYEKTNQNVFLHINERNKNYTYNFIDGLFTFKNDQSYDYFSFADQDDFWVEDKLISAINKLKEVGDCSLYTSNLSVVDENLNSLNRSYMSKDFVPKRHDQLYFCMAVGCTAVFDNKFKNLVTKHYPEGLVYHDYWVGLIANYCNNAHHFWDPDPSHIMYRQHGNNVSGGSKEYSGKEKFMLKIKSWVKGIKVNFYILKLLLKYYENDLCEKDKIIIEKFIYYKKLKNKIYIIKHCEVNNSRKVNLRLFINKYKDKKLEEM